MKLYRPYIPVKIRIEVAEYQLRERGIKLLRSPELTDGAWLKICLSALFGGQKVELHHRPALVNRHHVFRDGVVRRYIPDANDPDHLVFLPKDEHMVETRVRGQHGDYSDLAKARKRKRAERKRENRHNNLRRTRRHRRLGVRRVGVSFSKVKRKMQRGIKSVIKEVTLQHGITKLETGTKISGVTDVVPEFWGKPYPRVFCKHGVNVFFRCLACNPKRKWPKRKLRSRNDLRRRK